MEANERTKCRNEIFIVENISPKLMATLGGQLGIPADFFVGFLGALSIASSSETNPPRTLLSISPKPWYRFGNIQDHIPPLDSTLTDRQHLVMHFITPRQIPVTSGRNTERVECDRTRMHIQRVGAISPPVGNEVLEDVLLIRNSAACWFGYEHIDNRSYLKGVRCDICSVQASLNFADEAGLVLLDPQFQTRELHIPPQPPFSVFCSDVLVKTSTDPSSSSRTPSLMDALVQFLRHPVHDERASDIKPATVVEGLSQLVAAEWIATSQFIERDIANIEVQLEADRITIEQCRELLGRLVILRRRTAKYQATIEEQCKPNFNHILPSWPLTAHGDEAYKSEKAQKRTKQNFDQALRLMSRSATRTSQAAEFLHSIIIARETQIGLKQTVILEFLALVASAAVPFSAVAGVLGMGTPFGPAGERFGVFWATALSLLLIIGVLYGAVTYQATIRNNSYWERIYRSRDRRRL